MRKIPIGIDDFKKIRQGDYYYIDKTLLIKELLNNGSEVKLITRPRRFGKTLNMSMLRYYFERGTDISLFKGLAIEKEEEKFTTHMGRYPVIFLTLKSAKQPTWESALNQIAQGIINEFRRHVEVLESDLLRDFEKDDYKKIVSRVANEDDYKSSLQFLSNCLEKVYGEKVIILIDEYDVPLENAFMNGFYDQMIAFIRTLFESALKTNSSLAFAVLNGCLRISKESIFTGLNNLSVFSIRKNMFSAYFGFTEGEIKQFLNDYGLSDQLPEVRQWYDGYLFGRTELYNPWSIVNYVQDKIQEEVTPIAYWSNTSSNSIIRSLLERIDEEGKSEIEELIAGRNIEKIIHEEMTYQEIYNSIDNIWNFLFFTGYLTKITENRIGLSDYVTLRIPNDEVKYIFENQISSWFKEIVSQEHQKLYQALLEGDAEGLKQEINKILRGAISYMDSLEAFYHGVMVGILSGMFKKDYRVISNRESGRGRADILLLPTDIEKVGIVMELKVAKIPQDMEEKCQEAIDQIERNNYADEVREHGCSKIYEYGFAFYRKNCKINVVKKDK